MAYYSTVIVKMEYFFVFLNKRENKIVELNNLRHRILFNSTKKMPVLSDSPLTHSIKNATARAVAFLNSVTEISLFVCRKTLDVFLNFGKSIVVLSGNAFEHATELSSGNIVTQE